MKRFYKQVSVAEGDGGWRALLDGRGIKSAAGRPQVVPTRALAEALAAEWDAQGETIEPSSFHLRDLADFVIDAIAPDPEAVINELLPYAETDTLCYRADPEDALHKRQLAVWEPLLARVEERLGVRFARVSGVLHKPQPAETIARLRNEVATQDAYSLAALKVLASLAASLTIALEAIRPGADADALWQAANLEEEWQVEMWGDDWEAAENRAARVKAFNLAIQFATLAR